MCRMLFYLARQPQSGRTSSFTSFLDETHNDGPQSVRRFWTSDQIVAETSTWQNTTLQTNIHAPGGIRTSNLSRRADAELHLRTRGYWGWLWGLKYTNIYIYIYIIYSLIKCNRVDCIATANGLDCQVIESRCGRHFPHLIRPALRPTQPSVKWVPVSTRR